MLTFKQYLKEQELKESNPLYFFWGFIKPEGEVIEKSGEEQESEGCHEKMIKKLGFINKQAALRAGWVRWGLTNYNKTLFFDYYLRGTDPYTKNAMVVLAEKYKKLWNKIVVDDEWSGRGRMFTTVDEFKKEVMR